MQRVPHVRGRILALASNQLRGILPGSVWTLGGLRCVQHASWPRSSCLLSQGTPRVVDTGLAILVSRSLRTLELSSNQLEGTIDDGVGNLQGLQYVPRVSPLQRCCHLCSCGFLLIFRSPRDAVHPGMRTLTAINSRGRCRAAFAVVGHSGTFN